MTAPERTLVLLKPDAVRRGLVGAILARYEVKGFAIVAMQLRLADQEITQRHYAEHVAKPWFPEVRAYLMSGPLVALVLEGDSAIKVVRLMNGVTDSAAAAPGTIRGDYSVSSRENLVHASDSAQSAEREIALWFPIL